MKKINILILLVCLLATRQVFSQDEIDTTYIDGLRKAEKGELDSSTKLMLDGESVPVYIIGGERVRGMELMTTMQSGNYKAEIFINDDKEIKAVVLEERENVIEKGKSAIGFSVSDINGNSYSINDLKGKVVVLNFWFTGCQPCIQEMPELNELVKEYLDKEVVFIAFALDNKEALESFLEKRSFDYNIISEVDTKPVVGAYGVTAYPTHLVLDQNSIIKLSSSGYTDSTVESIKEMIEKLL